MCSSDLKASDIRIIIGAPGNGAVLKEALKEKLAGDERVSALVDLSTPDITYSPYERWPIHRSGGKDSTLRSSSEAPATISGSIP